MGYINKKTRYIIDHLRHQNLPKNWNMYIYDLEKKHNLIIKNKNQYYCTNCHTTHVFKNNNGPKIKQDMFCCMCGNTYVVRSSKIKRWKRFDDVILLDKVENELIVRIFEMRSEYDSKKLEVEHSTVEYARRIVGDNYREIRNDRVSIAQCGPWVVHRKEEGEWRAYDGNYESPLQGYLYFDNLKNTLKDTQYEKSRLWELAKVYKDKRLNIKELLYEAKCESFESLIEMKLYELAFDARSFVCKGSFKKIFGVDKTYYQFMKKHNISLDELSILRKYPIKDIRNIRFLLKYRYSIEEIAKYTSIEKFITYFRKKRLKDGFMYKDYLENAKLLGFDLKNKKYLFPENLKKSHDKLVEVLKRDKNEIFEKNVLVRYDELSKNIYKSKKFIIRPPKNKEEFISEATQQGNCVYTNYYEKYVKGECDIYFMREIATEEKSLVTIEVNKNVIIQKELKGHKSPNEEQLKFLIEWQNKILQKAV